MNKSFSTLIPDLVLVSAIILITSSSFHIGEIASEKRNNLPILITEPDGITNQIPSTLKIENDLILIDEDVSLNDETGDSVPVVISVKSKSGVYHFPWCSGASRISQKNKKEFSSEQSAIDAGYKLAGNCKK